jgi:hypothetical protein
MAEPQNVRAKLVLSRQDRWQSIRPIAKQQVIPVVARHDVVTVAADQGVVVRTSSDHVPAAAAKDHVGAGIAIQLVAVRTANHPIRPRAARCGSASAAGCQCVVSVTPKESRRLTNRVSDFDSVVCAPRANVESQNARVGSLKVIRSGLVHHVDDEPIPRDLDPDRIGEMCPADVRGPIEIDSKGRHRRQLTYRHRLHDRRWSDDCR